MTALLTPPPLAPVAPPLPVAAPAATPPPVVQPPPQPFRWTIKQYRELSKTGLFHDKKTMLLYGVLYVMVMPNPPHDTALGLTEDWLRSVFTPPGHHVRNQMGFDIGEDTDPGPDLAVVQGDRRAYAQQTPTTAVLIVEVSETTLFTDITTKAEKYATAKVPEYWVIDLENRQLIVFREPVELPAGLGASAYRQRNTYGPDATIAPLAAPTATVRVADLLP
ncbi:MAG: Uma2 family endonuclease [Gemmataceae bacterium]